MSLPPPQPTTRLIDRRHVEWVEHHKQWRFLADSLEGGSRYRHADYAVDPTRLPLNAWWQLGINGGIGPGAGIDRTTSEGRPFTYGQIVDRNLVPHLREMGGEGPDNSGVDMYVMRLHRTPVPNLVERAVEGHLGKVYEKEVRREAPKGSAVERWWADVDGRGTTIDDWMQETVAPLLMVLGQLDLQFDHPAVPDGMKIATKADARELGAAGCVASIILPENMLWWDLDARGRYVECLVFERYGLDAGYRHWTIEQTDYYNVNGIKVEERSRPNPFGCVPIVRCFDRRKPRCTNVGRSRYEAVAEYQRAIYNADSELILNNVFHSAPRLQGPEEALQPNADIPIGPDRILPKIRVSNGTGGFTYEGFDYLDPPQGASEAISAHIQTYRDEADRDSGASRPAGMAVTKDTVAQSGLSKQMDQRDVCAKLAKIARTLEKAEEAAVGMALFVLNDRPPTPAELEAVTVEYPREFDLDSADDLANSLGDVQRTAAQAGALPTLEGELLKRHANAALPGLDEETQTRIHAEIESFLLTASTVPPDPNDYETAMRKTANTITAIPTAVSQTSV